MKRTKKKLRKVRQNQTRARKTSIGPTTLLSDAYSFFGPKQAESINLEKYWDRLTDLISRNDYRDADSLAKDPMLIHTTNRSLLHLASVFFNMAARSDIAITLARRGRRITMGEEPTIYSYYFLIEFGIALAAVGRVGESKQAIQRALSIRQKSKIGIEYYPTYEDECDSAIRSHFERKEYGWVIVWGLRRVLSGKPNFEVQKLVSESFSELGLFEQARREIGRASCRERV
jgi:hypothetical protein